MPPSPRPARGQARADARARTRRRLLAGLGALLVVAAIAVGVVLATGGGGGGSGNERNGPLLSIFQDDDHLLYSPPAVVSQTLGQLQALGVDEIRVTVLWSNVAPQPAAVTRPAGFAPRDPAAYPSSGWYPYDQVIELARQHGIGVDLNVTAPGPRWAMAPGSPNPKATNHFRPDPTAFGDFVAAVGRRYSGHFTVHAAGITATLPRVSFWTIWNEPNQPGWLYPQWDAAGGTRVMVSPVLYRRYTETGYAALAATGHAPASDTILVGELAPLGSETTRAASPIPPLRFLRTLYCLDDAYHPLRGAAAAAEGCPADAGSFAAANPALFHPTGFAHHPYSFFRPPRASLSDPNWAPLADLGRLEHALDTSLAAYGVHRTLPLYLTEYGYETNPPDPFRGVPLTTQAAYLDVAQHMAAADPRVRSMAQFLLLDAPQKLGAPAGSQAYWSTFQTGLRFANGGAKPSLAAYALPLDVVQPAVAAGTPVRIWAMLRPAPNGSAQTALVQWRSAGGEFRTVTRVRANDPGNILTASVSVARGPGEIRLRWAAPSGQVWLSRTVAVRSG